jgi:hypothetical protein
MLDRTHILHDFETVDGIRYVVARDPLARLQVWRNQHGRNDPVALSDFVEERRRVARQLRKEEIQRYRDGAIAAFARLVRRCRHWLNAAAGYPRSLTEGR